MTDRPPRGTSADRRANRRRPRRSGRSGGMAANLAAPRQGQDMFGSVWWLGSGALRIPGARICDVDRGRSLPGSCEHGQGRSKRRPVSKIGRGSRRRTEIAGRRNVRFGTDPGGPRPDPVPGPRGKDPVEGPKQALAGVSFFYTSPSHLLRMNREEPAKQQKILFGTCIAFAAGRGFQNPR